MRIQALTCDNFLGLSAFSAAFTLPMTLIAGPNGAGKSSLLEAVRFALRGDPTRGGTRKADLPALLTHGASKGSVLLEVDGREIRRSIKTGELAGKVAVPPTPEHVDVLLSTDGFMALPEVARRKLLTVLLQVETTPKAIAARLRKAKIPAPVVADLEPVLAKGFEAAEKHAKARASEARGAWKALTGENYGSEKAEDWRPLPPATPRATAAQVAETRDAIARAEAELGGVQQQIGAASRAMTPDKRAEHAERAAKLPDLLARRERGLTKKQGVQQQITELEPKATHAGGTTAPCPHCRKPVLIDRGHLKVPVEADPAAIEQATADLRALRTSLQEIESGLRAVDEAIRGAELAKTLLSSVGSEPEVDVEALHQQREKLEGRIRDLRTLVGTQQREADEEARMQGVVERAAAEHANVLGYVAAAEQLGPNGIQAVLVASVLTPVNEALAATSAGAAWGAVTIDGDMVLHYAGRPYPLCSESERWRCDLAMTLTLAKLSSWNLVLVDRFDVLDVPSRGPTLKYLAGLAADGWQILLAGTLKEAPALPGIQSLWLDDVTAGRKAA